MAEEAEDKIIIDLEIKDDNAEDRIKAINALTSQLIKSNTDLVESSKKLASQGESNSTQFKNNGAQLEANQKAVAKNNAEVKNLSSTLKENSATVSKSKLSLQDYAGGLDRLVPGFDIATSGLNKFAAAGKALLLNPIGIVLAAVAAVLALISLYFTRTEEGGDKLAIVMAQLSAVFNVLVDRATKLAGALVSFFSGDFAEAAAKATEAVSGFGDELEREIEQAEQLANLLDQLEEKELKYGVAISSTTNEIKRLVIESKNRNLSEQEKIDLLQQAFNIEVGQNEKLKQITADKLKAAVTQFDMDALTAEGKRKAGESDIDYANRIIGLEKEKIDQRKLIADAIKSVNEAEGQSLNLQEKLQNKIDENILKQKEKAQKRGEEVLKQLEIERQYDEYLADKAIKQKAKEDQQLADAIKRIEDKNTAELDLEMRLNADMAAENEKEQAEADKNYAKDQAREKKKIELAKQTEQAKIQLALIGSGIVLSLLDKNTDAYKAAAIISTGISTYSAAQKAYESQLIPGDPTSIFRAVAAAIFSVVEGLGRLNQIEKMEDGGEVGYSRVGGRRHSEGGTRLTFEAEAGEGVFVLNRAAHADFIAEQSSRNSRFGGRSWFGKTAYSSFALGGNVVPISNPGGTFNNQQFLELVVAAVQSLPAPQVAVMDINAGQAEVRQVEVNAQL